MAGVEHNGAVTRAYPLRTERLVLREWQETDLDDFHAYCRNPNVGPAAGWAPHPNR